ASALVSIHEGVILSDVKQVGSRHGVQILVEKLGAEGRGRHAHGRLQETQVPKTLRTSVSFDLVGMDLENFSQGEKSWLSHKLTGQALEQPAVFPVDGRERRLKPSASLPVSQRREDEVAAVGSDLEGGLGVNFE